MNMPTARILAVASGGGHWIQMQRLQSAFAGHHVTYATVGPCDSLGVAPAEVRLLPDANAKTPLRMLWLLVRVGWLVLRIQPDIVITTGAASGYWAIRFGRLIGAKTIFLDSIANAEQLSLSARLAVPHADVTLTQWAELATNHQVVHGPVTPAGPHFWGAVV
ncbi:MAG: UDP-N-acetylglucosamine--LPS N-acetylglucosamine transferase [Planctomycetota bacterium]|nr:MAG: UDP-N-acetylglucosamine--LPS N-acetylglucosamine transferase [Planctomycetota bacterium]